MMWVVYVLVGVGVAATVAWWVNRRKQLAEERQRHLTAAHVTNDLTRVGPGGVLHLPPFGSNRGPAEVTVRERHRYADSAARPWYELVCDHAGRELLVEWSRDGSRLFVTATYDDESPSLADLGLTEDDLIHFDEEQTGGFAWDGVRFELEQARETDFFEDDRQAREQFYRWSFHGPGDARWLTVEKWPGENRFHVYSSWRVEPERIEVFDAGKAAS